MKRKNYFLIAVVLISTILFSSCHEPYSYSYNKSNLSASEKKELRNIVESISTLLEEKHSKIILGSGKVEDLFYVSNNNYKHKAIFNELDMNKIVDIVFPKGKYIFTGSIIIDEHGRKHDYSSNYDTLAKVNITCKGSGIKKINSSIELDFIKKGSTYSLGTGYYSSSACIEYKNRLYTKSDIF